MLKKDTHQLLLEGNSTHQALLDVVLHRSLVRLESGHLAVVVAQNPSTLVDPVLKLFYSVKRQMPVTPQVVDLAAAGCHDRIVAREQRLPGQFPWLDGLWADTEVLRRMNGSPH